MPSPTMTTTTTTTSSSSSHTHRRSSGPTPLPVPHHTLPTPSGQDLDFISILHSHLLTPTSSHLLPPLLPFLTPFRASHLLLRLRLDPTLSLRLYHLSPATFSSSSSASFLPLAILLHTLSNSKKLRNAQHILSDSLPTLSGPKNSSSFFDAVLASYRLCGGNANSAAFDLLFSTYARAKKFQDATVAFRRMRDYGFYPRIKSCNAFLNALLELGRTDIALAFFREMRRCGVSPNVFTINMVIRAYCVSGKVGKALGLFDQMPDWGFGPTEVTFNTLIAAHCRNGLMGVAVKLKNAMRGKGAEPNAVTKKKEEEKEDEGLTGGPAPSSQPFLNLWSPRGLPRQKICPRVRATWISIHFNGETNGRVQIESVTY